jgi:hypothetical protein
MPHLASAHQLVAQEVTNFRRNALQKKSTQTSWIAFVERNRCIHVAAIRIHHSFPLVELECAKGYGGITIPSRQLQCILACCVGIMTRIATCKTGVVQLLVDAFHYDTVRL